MPPQVVERLDQSSSLILDSDPTKLESGSGSGSGGQRTSSGGPNIKCVLVGDGSIGKTSLVVSYTINGYPTEYMPTAFDNYTVVVTVDNEPVTLQLCDTAGQDDFDSLRPLCYRDPATDIFLLCFSVVSPTSFHNITEKWVPEIRQHCPKTPIVLVGTQSDLRNDVKVLIELNNYNEKPVTESEAKARCREIGALTYMECSALTQKNLKEVFDTAILVAMDQKGLLGGKRRSKRPKKSPSRHDCEYYGAEETGDSSKTKKGWKKLCCFL